MRLSRDRTIAAALIALLALALTGCGDDANPAEEADSGATTTAPAGDAASETASEAPSGEAAAGMLTISGLSFAPPQGWEVHVVAELPDDPAQLPASIAAVARSQGMTPKDLVASLKVEPAPTYYILGKTGDRPEVLTVMDRDEMPTTARVEDTMGMMGAQVESIEKVQTPVGEGIAMVYSVPQAPLTFRGLVVPSDAGSTYFTLSTGNAGATKKFSQALQDSLAKA